MSLRNYWYVLGESADLEPGDVWGRELFGEWVAVFRSDDGTPAALLDRCVHRSGRLSKGKVHKGCLECPYHGWKYDGRGEVVDVPADGAKFRPGRHRGTRFHCAEQDGYVYVSLGDARPAGSPFAMPQYGQPGWHTIRLTNDLENSVVNCAENFIDIPHTVSVHPSIFRVARGQRIAAQIERANGEVVIKYSGETDNLGFFRRFLNPSGGTIEHQDRFVAPNVTSVYYRLSETRQLYITSQSIPITDTLTRAYTDVTFNYGVWNRIAAPLVRNQAQAIIDQDIEILKQQGEVIARYGESFRNMNSDRIHVHVRALRAAAEAGQDLHAMKPASEEIEFWV